MKITGDAFKTIGPPLARIGVNGKQILPFSADLSRCALEFQIELRAKLLKDIELVRSRLRRPNGTGHSYSSRGRYTGSRQRRLDRSGSHRTNLAPTNGPDGQIKIVPLSQGVNPNELP